MDGLNAAGRQPLQPSKPAEEAQHLRPGTKQPINEGNLNAARQDVAETQTTKKSI